MNVCLKCGVEVPGSGATHFGCSAPTPPPAGRQPKEKTQQPGLERPDLAAIARRLEYGTTKPQCEEDRATLFVALKDAERRVAEPETLQARLLDERLELSNTLLAQLAAAARENERLIGVVQAAVAWRNAAPDGGRWYGHELVATSGALITAVDAYLAALAAESREPGR